MKLNSSQNIINVDPIVSFINKENFHLFGSFSFIKINILVVGYDSYMDFIQSMGLVLSIKINFIHGEKLFKVMFYPLTHILVC
jgi:uracil DNA glycosylase